MSTRRISGWTLLASHGAEINHTPSGGCAGLGMAASKGQLDIVTFLLDNGAKPLPVSREGPELPCAARSGVSEIVQLLINHGYSSQGPRSLLRASFQEFGSGHRPTCRPWRDGRRTEHQAADSLAYGCFGQAHGATDSQWCCFALAQRSNQAPHREERRRERCGC